MQNSDRRIITPSEIIPAPEQHMSREQLRAHCAKLNAALRQHQEYVGFLHQVIQRYMTVLGVVANRAGGTFTATDEDFKAIDGWKLVPDETVPGQVTFSVAAPVEAPAETPVETTVEKPEKQEEVPNA